MSEQPKAVIMRRPMKYNYNRKPVAQYTKDGKLVAIYESVRYASEVTGVYQTGINQCTAGVQSTAGGFKWKEYREN